MLHLGNLDYGDGQHAALSDPQRSGPLVTIEKALGVTNLADLLLKRSIKIGAEVTRIEHEPKQAIAARDALVKIMCAPLTIGVAPTRLALRPSRVALRPP